MLLFLFTHFYARQLIINVYLHKPFTFSSGGVKYFLTSIWLPGGSQAHGFIDNLLSDVQADFLEKDAAEALRKQEELIQEKIRQEKLKAKQREALEKPAQEWLAKLDPLSSEGLWFERFAQGYPTKLAAAIDYLPEKLGLNPRPSRTAFH